MSVKRMRSIPIEELDVLKSRGVEGGFAGGIDAEKDVRKLADLIALKLDELDDIRKRRLK